MTREKRANLLFISILLVLLIPGFVILMRKKLNGGSDPNYMPQPLPHAAAYMQPPPIPPTVPRVEPAEVLQWVTNLLHERVAPDVSVLRNDAGTGPVIGDRFTTQVVYVTPATNEQIGVYLLVWDPRPIDSPITFTIDGKAPKLPVTTAKPVDVPKNIRHILQRVGYIDPPQRVAWVNLSCEVTQISEIIVQYAGITETVRFASH